MNRSMLFWLVYVVAVILLALVRYPFSKQSLGDAILFALIGLLGWSVYGPMVR